MNLPEDWKILKLNECIKNVSIPSKIKIKRSNYKKKGKYPIVDQGEGLIGGYTNDKKKLFSHKEVIIFGDHTRRIKYVNFPFCIGADGTKVFVVDKSKLIPKFFYFQLKQIPIENAGYSRHYKFLKRKEFVVPPIKVQARIVTILEKADNIRKKRKLLIKETQKIMKNIYLDMFGDPIYNPKRFPHLKLGDIATINAGGTPRTNKIQYYRNGKISWMKSGDIKDDFIQDVPNKITKLGLKNSNAKIYKKGDVVIALSGQGKTRATTGILEIDTSSNQSVASISPNPEYLISDYLHFNLKLRYKQLRDLTGDKQRSGLNLKILRNLKIAVPPIKLQKEFSIKIRKLRSLYEIQNDSFEQTKILLKSLTKMSIDGILTK